MQGQVFRILLSLSIWSLHCVHCTNLTSRDISCNSNDVFSEQSSNEILQIPGPISDVTVCNVTFSTLTLTWMEISLRNSEFCHYTVFYLPVRNPYGPITTSNRGNKQSTQAGELSMNFCRTTGTLTGLHGAVTYRIQVAVVTIFNGQEITGDRSAAIEMTTLEDVPTAPQNLNFINFTYVGCALSVTLRWRRPARPNGLIIQYNVSYSVTNLQGEKFYNYSVQEIDSNSGIYSTYTWTGLIQGNYQFSVVAFTNKGAGKTAGRMLPTLPDRGGACNDGGARSDGGSKK